MLSFGTLVLVVASAHSASVTNSGASAIVLVIVEDGNRTEVSLDAGSSESICPTGCFVTLPNGDRLGLQGGESVDIKDGIAIIN
ncbi:hypothetical protein FE840_015130 [Peteryoungia desertarenae]|uniref:Uncharacterized protein n=2 Tax=Peteryoungia desertarenae TaxID=1813451 RepID=A0ABX6QSA1_9HYPH|nr:hypothetical protein [Peteryoungia desertarenae]QLF71433.1 hypothetical protein FE840_015130 [Peteryoungia desertarenae]